MTTILLGCSAQPARHMDAAGASGIEAALSLVGPGWPAGIHERVTTSGDIYLANLGSQIASMEKRRQRRQDDRDLARLARLRYHRFQVLGKLQDAIAAKDALESAFTRAHDPAIDLAAIQVLMGFHQFDRARRVLRQAAQGGAGPAEIQRWRAAIDSATRLADTLEESQPANAFGATDPNTLVKAAGEWVERGAPATATALLQRAQENYTDSSPHGLAWIHVQQGIVFVRYDELDAARTFFAAAHERFPRYALATEHLAESELKLGHVEAALTLYRQVAEQTGNPEFWYRLSLAERQLGRTDDANEHARFAREGYRNLLIEYPTMYAGHAARYFIDTGVPGRAHALALKNFAQRQDIRAQSLLIETASLTGNRDLACRLLGRILERGYKPPELRVWAAEYPCDSGSQAGSMVRTGSL